MLVPDWGCDIGGCTNLWTHEVRYITETATARFGVAVFRCPEHKDDEPQPDGRYLSFEYEGATERRTL